MDIGELVAAHLPGHPTGPVTPLGAGLDHTVFLVAGALVVRLTRDSSAGTIEREAALLAAVAEVSPLPVPAPVFVVPESACIAYRFVPGRPVLLLPEADRLARAAALGAVLGRFLRALHAAPVERFAELTGVDDEPLAEWVAGAADLWPAVAGAVPAERHRAIEAFLSRPAPAAAYEPVFSHEDLGIEHVLADPATWAVTGVIDWSDAAVTDPARDFGRIHRDLGPVALDAALAAAGRTDPALRERAVAYARCQVVEDLEYGLTERRQEYVTKSLKSLTWLFPR